MLIQVASENFGIWNFLIWNFSIWNLEFYYLEFLSNWDAKVRRMAIKKKPHP